MTKLPETTSSAAVLSIDEAIELVCDAAERFGSMIDGIDEDCRLFDAIAMVRLCRPRRWRR